MKTVTVLMHPSDRRQTEVRWLLEKRFPEITNVEFREDELAAIPRATQDSGDASEVVVGIDAALFTHFGTGT
jgi:hypothetical protein